MPPASPGCDASPKATSGPVSWCTSEDRRLPEVGMDAEGDPIETMMEVSRRAQSRREEQGRNGNSRRSGNNIWGS